MHHFVWRFKLSFSHLQGLRNTGRDNPKTQSQKINWCYMCMIIVYVKTVMRFWEKRKQWIF